MNVPELILAIIGLAVAAGATTAYYNRSRGKETISLLQTNIQAYKDSEKLKDQRIAYLEGQVYSKEQTIKKLSERTK